MSLLLLTVDEMKRAEAAAMEAGASSADLMRRAGEGAAAILTGNGEPRPAAVLCGPGANGGDGLVIARLLKEAGWPVRAGVLGGRAGLSGDAAAMADAYGGDIEDLSTDIVKGAGVIVDALFGTGLTRPIEGAAAAIVEAANAHARETGAPVLAVDIPSGVNADTGAVMGAVIRANATATFFLRKPGHVLFPGRAVCGQVQLVDIGIGADVLEKIRPNTAENQPQLWGAQFPRPSFQTHKYMRGGVAVVTGPRFSTGAARLGAEAALRAGAGAVTLLSPVSAADENAAHATALMVRIADSSDHITSFLDDRRYRAVLFGPGAGVGPATRDKVLSILKTEASAVFDADALTSFEGDGEALFGPLRPDDVITPHEGEFMRVFAGLIETPSDRLGAARAAAKKADCIVVLKGADTVVAAPDGRASINTNAPPDLATAGAGDVLAGFIAGLRAQGMPAFEAASAGVWLHGACGQTAGPGLVSEDLAVALPSVYRALFAPPERKDAESA